MDKLFKILSRGEMPDFLQVLEALNEISDIDWDRVEHNQHSITDVLSTGRVPNYPVLACSPFCESCG